MNPELLEDIIDHLRDKLEGTPEHALLDYVVQVFGAQAEAAKTARVQSAAWEGEACFTFLVKIAQALGIDPTNQQYDDLGAMILEKIGEGKGSTDPIAVNDGDRVSMQNGAVTRCGRVVGATNGGLKLCVRWDDANKNAWHDVGELSKVPV